MSVDDLKTDIFKLASDNPLLRPLVYQPDGGLQQILRNLVITPPESQL
jgi:hypothetical protein